MDLEDARKRYLNDPTFHQLVTTMVVWIHELHTSPSELRQAALFASIIYDERNPKPDDPRFR